MVVISIFSWIIVFSVLLYFVGIMTVPFINDSLLPYIIILSVIIGGGSTICLLIVLIKERIKDKKEEEKNDLSKF